MQKFLRTLTLLAFLIVPWVMQGQNVSSYEYDQPVATAFTSISSSGTLADLTNGYCEIGMNHAFALGEEEIPQGQAKLRIYRNGYVQVLNGSAERGEFAPLSLSSGNLTGGSVYYRAQASVTTVEWRKVVAGTGNVLTFQLKVYDDNRVQFCYGPMSLNGSSVTTKSYLSDINNTNYLCCTDGWDALSTSTSSTATRTLSASNHPTYTPTNATSGMGMVYTFSRPNCRRPSDISTQVLAWNSIKVSWDLDAGDNVYTKFEIAYSTQQEFNADTVDAGHRVMITDQSARNYTFTNLSSNTNYYFAVRKYCNNTTASSWLYRHNAATHTPESCPAPYATNFTLSAAGVASWSLSGYPNINTVDIYYSTENVAPDAETTPSKSVAVTTESVNLMNEAAIAASSNTTWYVWFRGHCTIDGGTTLAWTTSSKNFTTPCGITALPYSENFTDYTTPSSPYYGPATIPDCWDFYSNGTNTAATSGSSAYYGSVASYGNVSSYACMEAYNKYFAIPAYGPSASYAAARGSEKIAVLPQFPLSVGAMTIAFDYKMTNATYGTLQLGYYANGEFTSLATLPSKTATTHIEQIIGNLEGASNAPAGARLALKWFQTSGSSCYWVGIDNVEVEATPTCIKPADVTVTALATTSVTLSWTGSSNSYIIEARQGDEVIASATSTTTTGTVTGLTANTAYDIYVKGVCATEQSKWSTPVSITTPCEAMILTVDNPYFEGFENTTFPSDCWRNFHVDGPGTYLWQRNTSSSYIHSGSGSAKIQDMNATTLTNLVTPPIAIASNEANAYKVKFWMYRNATGTGKPNEGVRVWASHTNSTDGATLLCHAHRYTGLDPVVASVGWYEYEAAIPLTGNVYIIFEGVCEYGSSSYMDDITIYKVPTCVAPTDLAATAAGTEATLSWTEGTGVGNAAATAWQLRYWNGSDVITVPVTSNPYTLTNLEMGTNYSWQVRTICTPGMDTSAWSEVESFTTQACLTITPSDDISLGEHTDNSDYLPFNGYYKYSVTEQIYTPAEIGGAVTINSISYNVISANSTDRNPVDIYLLETTKETFTDAGDASDWVSVAGLTPNYTGVAAGSSTGWQTITLTTPFEYSGNNNLLVVFVNRTGSFASHEYIGTIPATGNQAIYSYQDGSTVLTPANASTASYKNVLSVKNNFIFGTIICDRGTCLPPTVAIEQGISGDYGNATLTFTAPDENTTTFGYKYGVQGFDPATEGTTGTASATDNVVVINSLTGSTTYDIYVYSVCSGNNGRMVRYQVEIPFIPTCKTQTNFTASNVTYTSATISWQQLDPTQVPQSWTVRYSDTDFDPVNAEATAYSEEIVNATTSTGSLDLTGLHNGITYYIYTMATCSANDASSWTAYSITTPAIEYPTITDLTATTTSATLTWQDNNVPAISNWSVAYSTEYPFDADAVAITVSDNPTYTITGLTPNTTYYFAMRANYTANETGEWHVYGFFHTECEAVSIPYTMEFENDNCWTLISNNTVNASSSTSSSNYFGTTIYSGYSVLVFNSWSTATDYNQYAYSPLLNTTNVEGNNLRATVRYSTYGSSDKVRFGYSTTGSTNPADYIWSESFYTNGYTDWQTYEALVPKTAKRFAIHYDQDACEYKVYIDYVILDMPPTCWTPDSLVVKDVAMNSVTLAWRENSPVPATRWEVSYGIGITDPEEGTKVEKTSRQAAEITGLEPSTTYTFFVRALCSDDDQSEWSSAISATTACPLYTLPIKENFDNVATSSIPACWVTNNTSRYSVALQNSNRRLKFGRYAAGYVALPEVEENVNGLTLSFSAYLPTTDEGLHIGVMTNPADINTFDTVATINVTAINTWENFNVSLESYQGTGHFVAIMDNASSGTGYIDDLKLKVDEVTTPVADNGGTIEACGKLIIPNLDENENYGNNINATYILNTNPGYVVSLEGSYDLEYGYDFIDIYEGTDANATLVATLTGSAENFSFMTESYDWPNKGGIKMVFRTDEDNAEAHSGFHFTLSCEAPALAPAAEPQVVEANGTYTWAAPTGNDQTYNNQVVETGLTYDPEATFAVTADKVNTYTYTQKNVGGNDSIVQTLQLTLHPTYNRSFVMTLCERESVTFYGKTYSTTGIYTDTLTAQAGQADSTGTLALTVNAAPTAYIYYNNRNTNGTINGICEGFPTVLEARSNLASATFVWDEETAGANYTVNPANGSSYSLVATDPATGCTSLPTTVTINTVPVPALTISGDAEICAGQSTTLTLTDANEVPASYRWSNGETTTSITVSPVETTTYSVTATSTDGNCANTAEFTVTVNQLPVVASVTATPAELCQNATITLNATAVEGYSYSWNTGATTNEATVAANATGNFTVTVTDLKGCVKEFNTNSVTVNPVYDQNVDLSVCYLNNPYQWGEQSLTANGTYVQTFPTVGKACDSTVHLNFTFEEMAIENSTLMVCEGTQVTWGSQTITATENTTLTYDLGVGDTDPHGVVLECPARYNLALTVNTHNPASVEKTVCDSYTWELDGNTYTESGVHVVTLQTVKGCDSVVTLTLTVNYSNAGTDVLTKCDSYTWIDGNTYTESNNSATKTLKNAAQCDSVVTLNLTVSYKNYETDHKNICNAYSYTWVDGNVYNLSVPESDGITYTVADKNVDGCDSILILDLVLNPVNPGDTLLEENVTACDEYVVEVFNSETCSDETLYISESGHYGFRVHNAEKKVDQWKRINLTIGSSTYKTIPVRACDSYTWKLDNGYEVGTYSESGTYTYRKANETGCDSTLNLRLTIKNSTNYYDDTAAICQNGSWKSEDETVTINGDDQRLHLGENVIAWKTNHHEFADGCDTVYNVVLTLNKVYTPEDFDTIELLTLRGSDFKYDFDEDAYIYNLVNPDDTFQTAALPLTQEAIDDTVKTVVSFESAEGCDVTRAVKYHVLPTTDTTWNVTHCDTYTWEVNGKRYDHSYDATAEDAEDYVFMTTNVYGGDSIVLLNLTINDSIVVNETHYFCSEYTGPDGELYRESHTWRTTGESKQGCDSIHYAHYIVKPTAMTNLYMTTNVPYDWEDGNTYERDTTVWYETQTIPYEMTDEHGNPSGEILQCDSILVLHLTMVNDTAIVCENSLPYTYEAMGIVFDGTNGGTPTWVNPLDYNSSDDESFMGMGNADQWTQFRTRLFPGQHDGMNTVMGVNVANRYSDYITVELQVNGQTMTTKTLDDLYDYYWYQVYFDSPVRINDNDTVDFIYTMESEYAMYCYQSGANIGHPDNYQFRYADTSEWGLMPAPYNLYTQNLFGVGDDYYYTSFNEDHHDTILYYVVNTNTKSTFDTAVCAALTWIDGNTYSEDTLGVVYTIVGGNANGCDSTVTLNLHVGAPTAEPDTVKVDNVCGGYVWQVNSYNYEKGEYELVTVNKTPYVESGFYTYTATNQTGCDSVLVLNLEAYPTTKEVIDTQVCYSYTWTPMTYNVTTGEYEALPDTVFTGNDSTGRTLVNQYGCDSIVGMKVTILDSVVVEGVDSIVSGVSFTYAGKLYTAPYADTVRGYFTAENGCDSIYKFNLVLSNGELVSEVVNQCGDFTWRNGKTYTWIPEADRVSPVINYAERSGDSLIYLSEFPLDTLFKGNGTYDTILVLALSLQEASVEYKEYSVPMSWDSIADTTCTYVYKWNNGGVIVANSDTTIHDTAHYVSTYYCDSIVYYTFNLRYNYETLDTVYRCFEDSTYTTATGTVIALAVGDNDVIDTIDAGKVATEKVNFMVINRRDYDGATVTPNVANYCDSTVWNGKTYTVSGTYYDTTKVAREHNLMCDSITTITLDIRATQHNAYTVTVCDTFKWEQIDILNIARGNDSVYKESTVDTMSYTLAETGICTNVDTLKLTIHHSHRDDTTVVACDSFMWDRTGVTYYDSITDHSVYEITSDVNSCDDTIYLVLSINKSIVTYDTLHMYGDFIRMNGNVYTAPFESSEYTGTSVESADAEHPGWFEVFHLQRAGTGCDSTAYLHLTVANYGIVYYDTAVCGVYTWNDSVVYPDTTYMIGTGHTYRSITDEESEAHANARYFDVTANSYITENPVDTIADTIRGRGIVYSLRLTLNGAVFATADTSYMLSVYSEDPNDSLRLGGDFTPESFIDVYNAKKDTTVVRSVRYGAPSATLCDSIVSWTIHVVYNFDTLDTVYLGTYVDSLDWAATTGKAIYGAVANDTIRNIEFGDTLFTRNTVASGDTAFMVTTLPVTRIKAFVADTIIIDTVCDSVRVSKYGWPGDALLTESKVGANDDDYYFDTTTVMRHNVAVDSVTRLSLKVYNTFHNVVTIDTCDSYTWMNVNVGNTSNSKSGNNHLAGDNNAYSESGVYVYGGYDSTLYWGECRPTDTLKLTIRKSSQRDTVVFACDSYTWTPETGASINFDESDSSSNATFYTLSTKNADNCDSVMHLMLRVNTSVTIDSTIWVSTGSYRYTWNGSSEVLGPQDAPYDRTQIWESSNDTIYCDTTVNIHIHVGNAYFAAEDTATCDGYTWPRNGITYYMLSEEEANAHANYLYKHFSENGLTVYDSVNPYVIVNNFDDKGVQNDFDSIYTLRLSMMANADTSVVFNVPISLGSFTYNGTTYVYDATEDEARVYAGDSTVTDEFHFTRENHQAVEFCDSIVYLTLNWINNYDEVAVRDICVTEDTIMWKGEARDVHTDGYDTLRTIYFYDTVVNTEDPLLTRVEFVTVNQHPVTYRTERRVACDSYYWPTGDTTLTEATDMTIEVEGEYGCPVVVTLALTINKSHDSVLTTEACDSFKWNGVTYTESTDVTISDLTTTKGCDSTATLHLTMHYAVNTTDEMVACDSTHWTFGAFDTVITTSGSYTHTFASQYTCDSTVTMTVNIKNAAHNAFTQTACDSLVWHNGDTTYYAGGNVLFFYEAENGCASVDTIHLTLINTLHAVTVQEQCDGKYTWWAGANKADSVGTYDAIGENMYTYEYTTTATGTCTNVDTLYLTINHNYGSYTEAVGCHTYDWTVQEYNTTTGEWENVVIAGLDATDTFYHDFVDDHNCAGTDTLVLTIGSQRTFVEMSETACESYTWVVNDSTIGTFTNSADLTVTLPNGINGCDSVVTLHLTILEPEAVNMTKCQDELPVIWNEYTFDTVGEFTALHQEYDGQGKCIASQRLNLTVNPTYDINLTDQVCLGNGYNEYNFNISADELTAGVHTFTQELTSGAGCDSIVTLTLTVGDVITSSETVEACDSYTWSINNVNYTQSGDYTYTYDNVAGCLNVDTLHLTINRNNGDVQTVTACESYNWTIGNLAIGIYTENGTYSTIFTDANGCLGVGVLNLTIAHSEDININETACDSYTWTIGDWDTVLTESGVYTHAYATDNCEGIETLTLTVNNSQFDTIDPITTCDSYEWNGVTYTESGMYSYTTEDVNGCDSTTTVVLTINKSKTENLNPVTACDSFEWNDSVYTESTVASYTTTGVNGCDSTTTLSLTINAHIDNDVYVMACDSYIWEDNDNTEYTESGDYTRDYFDVNGCAATETLHLVINTLDDTTYTVSACDEYTWTVNDMTYTESGVYTAPITDDNNCTATATLNLTINTNAGLVAEVSACDSYTWDTMHTTYTESGVYEGTTIDENGCVGVATLTLTINHSTSNLVSESACGSYEWHDQTYTESGIYTYNGYTVEGCDSIVTLALTINNPVYTSVDRIACDSYTWSDGNGQTYDVSGSYTFTATTPAANGCDSIVTLNLTINNSQIENLDPVTACDSYEWNGVIYTESQTITVNGTNMYGCDSTTTLTLTINNSQVDTLDPVNTCNSYEWNGTVYTVSGEYSYTTTGANGCDSTTILSLTINDVIYTTEEQTACDSYTWVVNGDTIGTYTVSTNEPIAILSAASGCDSIINLNLTIRNSSNSVFEATACDSYTWELNNVTYTESNNSDYVTLVNAAGCDSIVTLNLTVNYSTQGTVDVEAYDYYTWYGETYTETPAVAPTHMFTNAAGCDSTLTLNLTILHYDSVTVVLSVNDPVMGTTNPVAGTYRFYPGDYVTATATANGGYIFTGWVVNGDTASLANDVYIDVTPEMAGQTFNVVATFKNGNVGIETIDYNSISIYSVDNNIYVKGAEGLTIYLYDVNGRCMERRANAADMENFTVETSGVFLIKAGDAPAKRIVVIR